MSGASELETRRDSRDPYRLFNLDVFRYGPGDPVPLYGSLPYLLAHRAGGGAAGALWLNAADTHVDIWRGAIEPDGESREGARGPAEKAVRAREAPRREP